MQPKHPQESSFLQLLWLYTATEKTSQMYAVAIHGL